jgi:hypothetical protein
MVNIVNGRGYYNAPTHIIEQARAAADRAIELTQVSYPQAVATPLAKHRLWVKAFELNLAAKGYDPKRQAEKKGSLKQQKPRQRRRG